MNKDRLCSGFAFAESPLVSVGTETTSSAVAASTDSFCFLGAGTMVHSRYKANRVMLSTFFKPELFLANLVLARKLKPPIRANEDDHVKALPMTQRSVLRGRRIVPESPRIIKTASVLPTCAFYFVLLTQIQTYWSIGRTHHPLRKLLSPIEAKSTMAEVPYHSNNPAKEAPANSETAVEEQSASLSPQNSRPEVQQQQPGQQSGSMSSSQPGSAEAAADKLFEERMEDEYAKREGGA